MKERYISFIFLCFSVITYGQTSIYQENFTGQLDKGASGSAPSIDVTGVTWTINTANANLSNSYSFNVVNVSSNELFQARNVGSSTWLTPIISISSFTNVGFTIDASKAGNLENSDTVLTQYRINGGLWLNATTNGTLSGNYENVTISQTQISGNTLQLRVTLANDSNGERQYIDNILVTGIPQPITYIYNNEWSPGNPSGVSLIQDDIIIQTGNASISANTNCKNFTVRPGASLTLNNGINLTTDIGLKLESTSTNYSNLISNGNITGNVNYERFVNVVGTGATGNGGNDLISLPLMPSTGLSFDEFITFGNPANSTKIATNNVFYAFGPYNNAVSFYTNFSVLSTENLVKAKGYRVATSIGENLTFSGEVVAGIVSIPVSTPIAGSQWNLIGNPYPSYINSIAFLEANLGVFDASATAIYGYNSGTYSGTDSTVNNFTIINMNSNSNLNIAPGQGFFIAARNTVNFSGAIGFTDGSLGFPDMRTTIGSNDFVESRTTATNHNLKLRLTNSKSYITDFYFNSNSSLGLDPGYDAVVYGENATNYPIYSQLVNENLGRAMAIQSLSETNLLDVVVPIGVNAQQGEQITFDIKSSTLPVNINVYLQDNVANTSTLLTTSDYVITPTSNVSGTGRFFLRFSAETLSTSEENFETIQIYTIKSPKTLFIKGALQNNTTIEIYDVSGRMILKSKLDTRSDSNDIDISGITTGVYVVKLNNEIFQKSEKVIIN